jgi:hypothetical protein
MTNGADQAVPARRSHRPVAMLVRLDAALFAFAGLSTLWLAYLLVRESVRPGWPVLLLVVFWVLLTYLLLPRLHRILTRIYVPRYFIGRAHTSDGLLGDPINLALRGNEAQVHLVMSRGGWTRADDLSLATGLQIVRSTVRRRSYPGAPVSPLLLFERQQDFAYQQQVDGSPSSATMSDSGGPRTVGCFPAGTPWIGLRPAPMTEASGCPSSPCRSLTRSKRTSISSATMS